MELNLGNSDRGLRILVGVLVLSVLFIDGNGRWFGLLGFIPLLTGVAGSCPLYSVFGWSTRRPRPKM